MAGKQVWEGRKVDTSTRPFRPALFPTRSSGVVHSPVAKCPGRCFSTDEEGYGRRNVREEEEGKKTNEEEEDHGRHSPEYAEEGDTNSAPAHFNNAI